MVQCTINPIGGSKDINSTRVFIIENAVPQMYADVKQNVTKAISSTNRGCSQPLET